MGGLGTGELVLLAILAAAGFWIRNRARKGTASGDASAAGLPRAAAASPTRDRVPELRGEIDRLRDGLQMLAREVDQLRAAVGELSGGEGAPALPSGDAPGDALGDAAITTPVPSKRTAASAVALAAAAPQLHDAEPADADGFVLPPLDDEPRIPEPAVVPSPVPALREAFVRWCRERGPLASKRELFAQFLRLDLPSSSVEVVYRDRDSPSRPLRFGRRAGVSPAEYWLVDAAGHYLLLPVPQGPSQFRDLAPSFEGAATPATLATFRPAELDTDGDTFLLTQPGLVG